MIGDWFGSWSGEPLTITIIDPDQTGWECDFCGQKLQQNQPLYLMFHEYEGAVMAHTDCRDKNSTCPNCEGRGWIRIPGVPANTFSGLLGPGIRSTEQCPVCNGDKFISNTTVMGQVIPETKEIDK